MPYKTIQDLPASTQRVLPQHAQEIFLATFNHAWSSYDSSRNKDDDQSREAIAHKIARSAVKKTYEKKEGIWQRK